MVANQRSFLCLLADARRILGGDVSTRIVAEMPPGQAFLGNWGDFSGNLFIVNKESPEHAILRQGV